MISARARNGVFARHEFGPLAGWQPGGEESAQLGACLPLQHERNEDETESNDSGRARRGHGVFL